MTYPEYKIAAERHLETCWSLVEKLNYYEDKRQKASLNSKDLNSESHLLANLYYLSGYMLECMYSYAMCKYENNRATVSHKFETRNDLKDVLDQHNGSVPYLHTYRLCFSHQKRPQRNVRYSITRDKHQMSLSELSFFQNEGVINQGDIELLDGNTNLSSLTQGLFLNWSAYERYKINHFDQPNFTTVFDYRVVIRFFWEIVDVCAKISEHIIREITSFRKLIKKKPSNI